MTKCNIDAERQAVMIYKWYPDLYQLVVRSDIGLDALVGRAISIKKICAIVNPVTESSIVTARC